MTRNSIKEYVEVIRERCQRATAEERGKILDEFTKTTGLHWKPAIRMLNRRSPASVRKRRGRLRQYPSAEGLVVESPRVLLAYSLNGSPPDPRAQCSSALVVPGRECYYGLKWVERVELTQKPCESGRAIALEWLRRQP